MKKFNLGVVVEQLWKVDNKCKLVIKRKVKIFVSFYDIQLVEKESEIFVVFR